MPSLSGQDTAAPEGRRAEPEAPFVRAAAAALAAAGPHLRRLDPDVRPRHIHRALCWHVLDGALAAPGLRPPDRDGAALRPPEARGTPLARAREALRHRSVPLPALPADSGPERVGLLYQRLLDRRVVVAAGGFALAGRSADRKRGGSFYTLDALARPTVARALRPLQRRGKPLTVVDPAMGSGAFLLAALDLLAGGEPDRRATVAAGHLCGVDRDPLATELARWSLWRAVGDPALPLAHLRGLHCGNALTGRMERTDHAPGSFHWDAVFPTLAGRFDAVVGNPPWETLQPDAREFFSELDPEFRSLGKHDGLRRQEELMRADEGARRDWTAWLDGHRRLAGWIKGPTSPYRRQGRGKLYTYRLFLERAWQLLRPGGSLGMILPAAVYSDEGARDLRRMLLDEGRWRWLYAFENRRGLFAIDSRYRFAPVVAVKAGRTRRVRAAFLRHDPLEWAENRPKTLAYPRALVRRLSPRSEAFLELRHERDVELLDRLHRRGRGFLDDGFRFAQGDFNMTGDVGRFVLRDEAESDGFRPAGDDTWRRNGEVLLPLMQGGMIGMLHSRAAGHARGAGHRTRWAPLTGPHLRPQFLVPAAYCPAFSQPVRLVFRTLSNATNERTAIAAAIPALPCGNSLGILTPDHDDPAEVLFGAAVMASLVYDWALRQRLAGTNLNRFLLSETVWPDTDPGTRRAIADRTAILCPLDPRSLPDPATRRTLRVELDVAVARAYGLDARDMAWLLRDCHHPPTALADPTLTATLDPKGFWRVDRTLPPDRRHPVRVLAAIGSAGVR